MKSLVVFVHGFMGGKGTFGRFPEFLKQDTKVVAAYDIESFFYSSKTGLDVVERSLYQWLLDPSMNRNP